MWFYNICGIATPYTAVFDGAFGAIRVVKHLGVVLRLITVHAPLNGAFDQ